MKNNPWRVAFVWLAMLWLSPLQAANENPESKALVQSLLLTENDYLPFVKDADDKARLTAALLPGAGNVQKYDSFWTKDHKSYILMYVNLIGEGTAINCTLFSSRDEMEFHKISSEIPEGTRLGIRSGGASVIKIEHVKPSLNYAEYFRVQDPQGKDIGNLMFVSRGKNFLMVSVFGPTVFQDAASIDQFLSAKLEKAMTFAPAENSPDIPPQ